MADSKTSALTADTTITGTEELFINDGGVSKKTTIRSLFAYGGDAIGNMSTADQSPAANATTYVIGSGLTVPTGERIRVGTGFRWHGCVTKTAAGTAAKSILVKGGTAGSVADTTLLTFALPVGTAVVDTGYFEINVTVTAIGAGTAAIRGMLVFTHNLGTTGLITAQQAVVYATSATFDSTVNLLIFGVAFTAGVSEAWTFKQVLAEAKNL